MEGIKSNIYKIFLIILLLANFLSLIYCIWTTKLIKILFFIQFGFVFLSIIYSFIYVFILFDLKLNSIFSVQIFNYSSKIFSATNTIFFVILPLFYNSLLVYNKYKYDKFIKKCPFTLTSNLTSDNESYFEERRCELYNIYNNSRYKYQYICSYNASEDFKNDKTKDGLDKIICVEKINNINNNSIFNQFSKVYDDKYEKLFYCNSIEIFSKDEYIDEEYCNMKFKFFDVSGFLYSILSTIIIFLKHFHNYLENQILENYLSFQVERLRRLTGKNETDCSTDNEDDDENNISFNEEEDKNIIVENHEVNNIEFNIKNFIENEEKIKKE